MFRCNPQRVKFMKKTQLTSAAIFLLSIGGLQAQQSATSAGGAATGFGGSSSYTLGQTVYTTARGIGGSSSQGVQKIYEFSVVSGTDLTDVLLAMNAYPNPTVSNLTLTVSDVSDLSYQLYDLHGDEVESNEIAQEATQINLEGQPAAVYFLKVLQNNVSLKIFKIIKY